MFLFLFNEKNKIPLFFLQILEEKSLKAHWLPGKNSDYP